MTPLRKYRAPQDPDEIAARIRAARAWARLTRPELAERLGRSKSTIERMENGDPAALGVGSSKKLARLWVELAEATGIPSVFFLAKWDVEEQMREKRQASEKLEQRLEARLARIEGALGLSPGPSLAAVEEGLEDAFDEGDQRGAGTGDGPESEGEAGSRGT
jgi:transcriptional regulator with XRE-family HTH domain